jgi:hypothetical protein
MSFRRMSFRSMSFRSNGSSPLDAPAALI